MHSLGKDIIARHYRGGRWVGCTDSCLLHTTKLSGQATYSELGKGIDFGGRRGKDGLFG
jgi:hypothetical protein